MKRAGVISTAILFLLLGTTAPVYAQHEHTCDPDHAPAPVGISGEL